MNANTRAVIFDCVRMSSQGGISFGDVVGRLMGAGVERYHVDFVRGEAVYYLPDGQCEVVPMPGHEQPATEFSASGVEAAVRGAQSGTLTYPAFCGQALEAGCVGYLVSLTGRRVVYYGRTGDTHVERFPGAR